MGLNSSQKIDTRLKWVRVIVNRSSLAAVLKTEAYSLTEVHKVFLRPYIRPLQCLKTASVPILYSQVRLGHGPVFAIPPPKLCFRTHLGRNKYPANLYWSEVTASNKVRTINGFLITRSSLNQHVSAYLCQSLHKMIAYRRFLCSENQSEENMHPKESPVLHNLMQYQITKPPVLDSHETLSSRHWLI